MWSDLTFGLLPDDSQFKSAYNLLIIGPRDLEHQTNLRKSFAWNLLMWSDLALGPSASKSNDGSQT